jgi:hypothetical protein
MTNQIGHKISMFGEYNFAKNDAGLNSTRYIGQPIIALSIYNYDQSYIRLSMNGNATNHQTYVGSITGFDTFNQYRVGAWDGVIDAISINIMTYQVISEVIVFEQALNDEDRIGVEKYLSKKYNIPIVIEEQDEKWD